MPNPNTEFDTFARVMVALAIDDAANRTTTEIEQMADELVEWAHKLRHEFRRAEIADHVAQMSRAELEAQLAARLVPTGCCTQLAWANDSEPSTLSDADLRDALVDAEAFLEHVAA